jgi:hypothetical protein
MLVLGSKFMKTIEPYLYSSVSPAILLCPFFNILILYNRLGAPSCTALLPEAKTAKDSISLAEGFEVTQIRTYSNQNKCQVVILHT